MTNGERLKFINSKFVCVSDNDPKLLEERKLAFVERIFYSSQIQLNSTTDLIDSNASIIEKSAEIFQCSRFNYDNEKASD